MIDVRLLSYQLGQAGLRVVGCDADGQIWWQDGYEPTPGDLAAAARILSEHDPTKQDLPEVAEAKRLVALVARLESGTATTAERNEMLLKSVRRVAAATLSAASTATALPVKPQE